MFAKICQTNKSIHILVNLQYFYLSPASSYTRMKANSSAVLNKQNWYFVVGFFFFFFLLFRKWTRLIINLNGKENKILINDIVLIKRNRTLSMTYIVWYTPNSVQLHSIVWINEDLMVTRPLNRARLFICSMLEQHTENAGTYSNQTDWEIKCFWWMFANKQRNICVSSFSHIQFIDLIFQQD